MTRTESEDQFTYQASDEETLSEAVLEAIHRIPIAPTSVNGSDSIGTNGDWAPLYETIDLDALDELFRGDSITSGAGHVSFTHASFRVTVHTDGQIEVRREQTAE